MKRTQSRVLVVHRFSPLHALSFAGVAAITGITTLCLLVNPLTAALGVVNLILYAGVYTPLKRMHVACTWAGALVGAIPPLMGYAAATGSIDASALCLAAILYSWQFPHFNGLSWNLRGDYSKCTWQLPKIRYNNGGRKSYTFSSGQRSGHHDYQRIDLGTDGQAESRSYSLHRSSLTAPQEIKSSSWVNEIALTASVQVGLCSVAAPLTNLTTITFAIDTLPVNAYLCWLAYKFYSAPDASNSRRLFFYSLLYLPLIMILMVVSSYGRNDKQKTEA
ncbi:hypothetical protein GCK32_004327 [Trichostrongylus colubriformis]|uniref:Heme O synthase n=1 Tax=Trichostrongylus colubriformis TaxID=6319 RepID=A0AAN8FYS0_TRICO